MERRDIFLMIPCDLSNYKQEKNENEIGEYLIKEVEKNNCAEFKSDFIKCLERNVVGSYKITSNLIKNPEEGIFTITKHPKTNNGILIIFIPMALNKPDSVVQSLISGLLQIENEKGEKISVNKYLLDRDIYISGTPKALVFIEGEIPEQEVINILACESEPVDKIVGSSLVEMSRNNIAQYDSAKVYCGENVLLELQKVFIEDIKSRIANEAIEVFFMELLLLQDAAISRICNRIIKEIEIETDNPIRQNNIQVLDELSCETAQAILFLDFNCFIYPTVRNAAEVIAKNFGLDKLIERYYKYKDALETLISIHNNRINEMENKNMNILLLVLTLTQVVPIFADLFLSISKREFGIETLLSFISSIGVCFILLVVFNILRKRQLKKYKDNISRPKLTKI